MIANRPRRQLHATSGMIAIYGAIIALSLVMLFPFLYVLSVSLSGSSQNYGLSLWPQGVTLDGYRAVFQLPTVWQGYANSVIYTVMGTVIGLTLTVMCAYPLSRVWLFGRRTVSTLILLSLFVNVGLIPTYLVVYTLGWVNTAWAIVIPEALNPFWMFVAVNFFRGIPAELTDAAQIDGCGEIRTLVQIVLPLSKPILATLTLIYTVGIWNNWFGPAIYLSDQAKYPITLTLRNLMDEANGLNASAASIFGNSNLTNLQSVSYTLTIVVILPILVIYPLVQRYLMQGLLIGSLKG